MTCKRPFGRFCGHTSWIATFFVDWRSFVILIVNDLISDVFLDIAGENVVEMPKIRQLGSSSSEISSIHLRKIESVASSILSGHQKLVWSQRTRNTNFDISFFKQSFFFFFWNSPISFLAKFMVFRLIYSNQRLRWQLITKETAPNLKSIQDL